jgi:CheY-like chemotaxis protein
MTHPNVIHILVLEDDDWMEPVIHRALKELNPAIHLDWCSTSEQALQNLKARSAPSARRYDLIIADIFLNGTHRESGLDFWVIAKDFAPNTPILFTSAMPIDSFLRQIEGAICPPYLPKPFKLGEFKQMVSGLLNYRPTPQSLRADSRRVV